MPNVIQILRSGTTNVRPVGRAQGEIYWNSADRQLGVFNIAATDLIAVRYWVTTATYAAGDHVINGGVLYRAIAAVTPGVFNPAQWIEVGSTGNFLPLTGGTLSGPLTLFGPPTAALHAATMQYVDEIVDPYLPLAAGVGSPLTGELYLPIAAPSQPAVAANKAYVDAGDQALQDQISLLSSNLLFVGGVDVPNNQCTFTAASGLINGPLPAAAPGNTGFYVIVTAPGSPPAGNIPAGNYSVGDWIVSSGSAWIGLPTGQAGIVASNVAITPAIGSLGADVQSGLTWLDSFKLDLAGGQMTGALNLAADPVGPLQPVTLQYLNDIVVDAGVF